MFQDELVQSLTHIVNEHKGSAATSSTILQQEKIIKEQQIEIKRLNSDIKLLMVIHILVC